MPPDCNECKIEDRVARLENRVDKNETDASEAHKEMFDRLREIEKAEAVQSTRFETILEKLDGLTSTVSDLTNKPGRRWEAIVDKALWAVLAAVIAFLLAKIGL